LLQATQTEFDEIKDVSRAFTPPTVADLTPLFPHLEVFELLGRGGMGAVYKAKQKELDRVVALKILPPGIGDDPAFAERFAREAKAMAKLNHPGIVTIYDFGRVDGLYYFLMEFVDGVNLHRLLEGGRISPREALAIVPQICDALQYAHDQGIVHRDIKPQNIMLDRYGRVKVADFGLAKLVGTSVEIETNSASAISSSALTEAGKIMGTPAYMAPEQQERPKEVDHRADIYALGVVFYQLLTGELPSKPLEAPSRRVHIDVRLDEVVLKAMEEKPERRYEQASQLRTAVENLGPPSEESAGKGQKTFVEKSSEVQGLSKETQKPPPRWWQVFLAGFLTVALLEFGALALTDHGLAPLIFALLAGGVAVMMFLMARKIWLNGLLAGMLIVFLFWLAVVACFAVGAPLALITASIGVAAFLFAMKRLGASRDFFKGFIFVSLVLFSASAGITFIMPEYFSSTARIEIDAYAATQIKMPIYDPYLIQTEFEVLQSGEILGKVIENLNLNREWGRRYNGGQPFTTDESLALLKRSLDLRPVRNTSLIEIRVFAEEADKAASVANEIAYVYHDRCKAGRENDSRMKVLIVDTAKPGLRPVRPNKPFNLAIGALAGSLFGAVGGSGFAGYKSRKPR
jgi:serine/threonine protein kinase